MIRKLIIFGTIALIYTSSCNVDNADSDETEVKRFSSAFEKQLTTNGLSQTEAKALALAGEEKAKDKKDINTIVPNIVEGAVETLATIESTSSARLLKLDEIISAGFIILKGEGFELSKVEQKRLRGLVASAGIKGLKKSSIDTVDFAAATKIIMNQAVAYTDDSGIEKDDLKTTLGFISAEMILSFKSADIDAAVLDEMSHAMMSGSMEAIKDTSTDSNTYNDLAQALIEKSIGNMDELGFDNTKLFDILFDTVQGSVASLGTAGFSGNDLDGMVKALIKGAVTVFDDIGIEDTSLYASGLSAMIQGIMAGFDELYGTSASADSIEEDVGAVVFVAVSALSESFSIGDDQINAAMQGLGSGAITGLLNAGFGDSNDADDLIDLADTIVAQGISAINEAEIPSIIEDSDGNTVALREQAANNLVLGIVRGLEGASFVSDTQIKAASSTLASAATQALSDGGVVVASTALFESTLKTAIDNEADTDETFDGPSLEGEISNSASLSTFASGPDGTAYESQNIIHPKLYIHYLHEEEIE